MTKAVVPFFFDGHLDVDISHLLWRIERSLHEEDPGHHHGEHVLHPRRHLVGGRRPEVDVEHSDLAKLIVSVLRIVICVGGVVDVAVEDSNKWWWCFG